MLLFGSMAIYGWVAYAWDKNTCAKTLAEMKEGLSRLHMKGGVYAGHYGIRKVLRSWVTEWPVLFNCWTWTLATLQEKRWLGLEALGLSISHLLTETPKYYFQKDDVPIKLGKYKNKDDLVKRIKKIDSYVENIIL